VGSGEETEAPATVAIPGDGFAAGPRGVGGRLFSCGSGCHGLNEELRSLVPGRLGWLSGVLNEFVAEFHFFRIALNFGDLENSSAAVAGAEDPCLRRFATSLNADRAFA